jgi:ABC-type uncharacterized transport system substrate-binding protein
LKGYKNIRSGFQLLVFLILFFPVPSAGQTRIGVVMSGNIPYYAAMHQAFVDSLNARVANAKDIEIILQMPFPDPIAWSNAARKLIAFDVDVIVTYGSPATLAVVEEQSKIPVVYAGVYDPENAPVAGSNITGCGYKVPLSSLLRYMKRLRKVDALNVVFAGIEEDSVRQKNELEKLVRKQDITLRKINIRSRDDIGKLRELSGDDAVFVTGSALVHLWLDDILKAARKTKDPVADIFPDLTKAGVLMTLYHPPGEQGKMAAEMVFRILNGEQPKDIALDVHRDTELVFNLIEAGNMGIYFPIQLLVEATRVIK